MFIDLFTFLSSIRGFPDASENQVNVNVAEFCYVIFVFYMAPQIGHVTVYGTEAGVDRLLIQTFLLYHVNQVILMLTSIFHVQFFHNKAKEVCIKTRSPSASHSLEG